MHRRLRFLGSPATAMSEMIAWAGDAMSLTVWVFPAGTVVSVETTAARLLESGAGR